LAEGIRGPSDRCGSPRRIWDYFTQTWSFQRFSDEAVVLLHELTPSAVPDLRGNLGRADDIGEEDGRQESLGLTAWHRASLRASRIDFQGPVSTGCPIERRRFRLGYGGPSGMERPA